MKPIEELSQDLQLALANKDEPAIESVKLAIFHMLKKEMEARESLERQRRQEALAIEMDVIVERYPCTACGGKLVQPDSLRGVAGRFSCVSCKRPCCRDTDEDQTQLVLKARILRFKELIRKVIKITGMKVRVDKNLTKINGKPLFIYARYQYPTALALSYDNHYDHESLASGAESWDTHLTAVYHALRGILLGKISFEQHRAHLAKIRSLPFDQQIFGHDLDSLSK